MDWRHQHDLLVREVFLQKFHDGVDAATIRRHVLLEHAARLLHHITVRIDLFLYNRPPFAERYATVEIVRPRKDENRIDIAAHFRFQLLRLIHDTVPSMTVDTIDK